MQDGTADGFCFVAGGWLPLICFGLFFSSGWLVSSGGSASIIYACDWSLALETCKHWRVAEMRREHLLEWVDVDVQI